jgi:hypothetical protein
MTNIQYQKTKKKKKKGNRQQTTSNRIIKYVWREDRERWADKMVRNVRRLFFRGYADVNVQFGRLFC